MSFNSLDFNKFNNILTSKSELSRTLFEENRTNFSKDTKLTFLGIIGKIYGTVLWEKEKY